MRLNDLSSAIGTLLLAAAVVPAQAATVYVNGLGVGDWESGDTRPAVGGVATPAQIDAQIKFLGEGIVAQDAAGGSPDASPTGSLNGLGAVRLDGTSGNSGKSDIGLYNANGFAAASALLASDFELAYRAFSDPNTTLRTVGLGLAVSNGLSNCGSTGTSACYYTFSHIDSRINPGNPSTWLEDTVGATTGLFRLYGDSSLGTPNGSVEKTLADWAADQTWGFVFSDPYEFVRLNFNVGSSGRNGLVYVDWVESNLVNGGDRIDFVSSDFVAAVPEPGSLALLGLGLAGLAATQAQGKVIR